MLVEAVEIHPTSDAELHVTAGCLPSTCTR
jgi:hypothetical protein